MGRVHFLKAYVFTFFILVISLVGPAAAATSAEDIIAGWFQSLKNIGATVAKYDAVRADPATDTAFVDNMRLEWHVALVPDEPPMSLVVTASKVEIVGLRQETDGYRAKSYSFSDDYTVVINGFTAGEDGTRAPFVVKGTAKGYRSDGIFVPHLTAAPEDAQHPVSRFMHYYELLLKAVFVKSTFDSMVVVQSQKDEFVIRAEYQGMSVLGMQNGRIEEIGLKSFKQTTVHPLIPDAEGVPQAVLKSMETTYGKMVQRGVDIRVLVEALTGTQPAINSVYKVFAEEVSVSDINVVTGPVSMSIGEYRVSGMKVRPGQISLPDLADRMALGEKLGKQRSAVAAFDVARRFALDEWSISGLAGGGPPYFAGSMEQMKFTDLSSEGLGNFSIKGVEANSSGGEQLSFDNISVGKIGFPTQEAILAAIQNGVPDDPIAKAALGPRVGEIQVANLFLDDKTKPAFSLGLLKVLQSAFVGPIPTDIRFEARDLNLPIEYIDDATTQNMLRALGYDVLKIASDIALKWDEASQDLTLEKADLSLEGGGKVSLKAGVAGLPRSVIENPALFEQALATLAFKNVNLSVRDADLVSGLISHFAGLQKISPADLRASLLQTLELQAGPLAGTPFLNEVKAALGAFMEDPQRLSVDLAPEAPVPFTQILGTAATAPDQTPGLLGAMISAN